MCSQEFEGRSDAKTCSPACRTAYGRIKKDKTVMPHVELSVTDIRNSVTDKLSVTGKDVTDNLDEYLDRKYPDIEITLDVLNDLEGIYKDFYRGKKDFKIIPYTVKGVRKLTIWEKMRLQELYETKNT